MCEARGCQGDGSLVELDSSFCDQPDWSQSVSCGPPAVMAQVPRVALFQGTKGAATLSYICAASSSSGARSCLCDSERWWWRRKGRRHHLRPADGVPTGGTRPAFFQTASPRANAAALRATDSAATLDNRRTESSCRPPASGGGAAAPVSPRSRLRSCSQRSSAVDFSFSRAEISAIELHQGDTVRAQ